jgi:tetratricopeptide (TPR) repeat protein
MAIFESKSRRAFKSIQKMASDNMVDQAAAKVQEDFGTLIEEKDVARELVAFLMDIAYPDLAAKMVEEVVRVHKDLAAPLYRLLEDRHGEFPRSFEMLRTLWQSKIRQRDFSGCIELLDRVDRLAESKLMDSLKTAAETAEKFAGERLLEGDVDRFLAWSLGLYRQGRQDDALETLFRATQRVQRPDERIPLLVEWMATRKGVRDPKAVLYLIRIYLEMDNVENALINVPELLDAPQEIQDEAISIVEKGLVPKDFGKKSRVYLGRLLAAGGRTDDSSRVLGQLIEEGELGADMDTALRELVGYAPGSSRPLILQAKLKKERGEKTAAMDALEAAFDGEDADSAPLLDVCRVFLDEGLDRENTIAMKLAEHLVEHGTISDAVSALTRLVEEDPDWVTTQLQLLLKRERQSAEILSLLAVAMLIQGREAQAEAAIKHLRTRKDSKSREDILAVLDEFDALMSKYPVLRKIRAITRTEAGKERMAAEDWFELLLTGERIPSKGLLEVARAHLPKDRAEDLMSSEFEPSKPLEAMLGGIAAIEMGEFEKAGDWLASAAENETLAEKVAEEISVLPDDAIAKMDLERILPLLSHGKAAKHAADIVMRTSGSEPWRMSLVPQLRWDDPQGELLFRLRVFINEGKIALAGSATDGIDVEGSVLVSLAEGCRKMTSNDISGALEDLAEAASDRRTSSLARTVLEDAQRHGKGEEEEIRILIARTFEAEHDLQSVADVLDPVASSHRVVDELERITEDNGGHPEPLRLLVKAFADRDQYSDFIKRSSTLVDLVPEEAAKIMKMSEEIGRRKGEGQLLAYAAELSDRYHLPRDPEDLLSEAILAQPSVAESLAGKSGMGPGFKALCAAASGDAGIFTEVLRRRPNLDVRINEKIIDSAIERWMPGQDDEALSLLAEVSLREGFGEKASTILSLVAREGIGDWRTKASQRLLDEVTAGGLPARFLWESVRDPKVLGQALERNISGDLGDLPADEVGVVVNALTGSGMDPQIVLDFGVKLMEAEKEGVVDLLLQLGSYCYDRLQEKDRELSERDGTNLVNLLLRANMVSEASRVAVELGANDVLREVRRSLEDFRAARSDVSPEVRAEHMILLGKPSEALSLLGDSSAEEPVETSDVRARALWDAGQRQAALSIWLSCYRRSGKGLYLGRVMWALDRNGNELERTAVKRVVAERHPHLVSSSREDVDKGYRLETISGL